MFLDICTHERLEYWSCGACRIEKWPHRNSQPARTRWSAHHSRKYTRDPSTLRWTLLRGSSRWHSFTSTGQPKGRRRSGCCVTARAGRSTRMKRKKSSIGVPFRCLTETKNRKCCYCVFLFLFETHVTLTNPYMWGWTDCPRGREDMEIIVCVARIEEIDHRPSGREKIQFRRQCEASTRIG
jgi:hypothetical protein